MGLRQRGGVEGRRPLRILLGFVAILAGGATVALVVRLGGAKLRLGR
jgi:hypothetical protein